VVERLQQFDGTLGTEGLTLDLAVPSAGTTWVFADGEATAPTPVPPAPGEDAAPSDTAPAAPASSEKIVVFNPSPERAQVEVRVLPGGDDPGPAPQPFRLSVPGGAYEVIDYGDQARIAAGQPHTTVVHSTNGTRVVAQRVTVDAGPPPTRRRGPTGEVTAAMGARLAAPTWTFPTAAPADEDTAAFVVFNPNPSEPVRVRLDVPGPGRDGAGSGAVTEVPPGGRVSLDAPTDAGAAGVVVSAAGPVVAERVVRAADGRRVALAPGVPVLADGEPLDALAAAGRLAGAGSAGP
jgi:acetyl esterase/lipase